MSPWRVSGNFRNDGLFILPVWLNERSFKFLFDPGTPYSMLAQEMATLLELRMIGKRPILQGGYYPATCPVYHLDSFRIGFVRHLNVRMSGVQLNDQLDFDGLLGMDILCQYRFTLEPDTATLILRPRRK